jgi:D-xylose 1-dehydrogenase (NADP+, D-xylono-1,5-lactone-forming)
MARLRWGVLSTASIGRLVIEAARAADHAEFVAVASRDADRARAFAGAIGRLSFVRAALSVSVPPGDIRRSPALGGGALGDLGCYCVSAIRLFAGEPERVWAAQVCDGAAGVDLRLAATLQLPGDVLAQFDIALDLTRRDELELVGTEGRLTVPDPWLCRAGHLELSANGDPELIPVDPDGALGLTDPDHDVYRIELDTVSATLAGGGEPSFGRSDAVAQATVLEALHRSAELGTPIDLTRS